MGWTRRTCARAGESRRQAGQLEWGRKSADVAALWVLTMRLSTIVGLSRCERRLVFMAAAMLVLTRVSLWMLPFRAVRRLMAWAPRRTEAPRLPCARRVGWAVKRTSRFVPGASCLAQALTAEWLLRRFGTPGLLRIGVAKTPEGGLRAHAWVESEGRIVVGALSDLAAYTVLAAPARPQP
jgi:hypothetical protein